MSAGSAWKPREAAASELRSIVEPTLVRWVARLLGAAERVQSALPRARMSVRHARELWLLELCLPLGPADADEHAFCDLVRDAYLTLLSEMRDRAIVPLRWWNYLPDIGRPSPVAGTRYEVFSSGRFAAYTQWFERAPFDKQLRPASAVGHRGDELVVHVLAGRGAGVAIENPRQRPAYRYSRRYGPVPPSFARAMLLAPGWMGAPALEGEPAIGIVAGTASIVGEDSRHASDLDAQLAEIATNLAALARAMEPSDGAGTAQDVAAALTGYRHLRAYLVDASRAAGVRRWAERTFPALDSFELVAADLCRPELMVEIEGVLEVSDRPPRATATSARGDV